MQCNVEHCCLFYYLLFYFVSHMSDTERNIVDNNLELSLIPNIQLTMSQGEKDINVNLAESMFNINVTMCNEPDVVKEDGFDFNISIIRDVGKG